jgi:hypothetical protein
MHQLQIELRPGTLQQLQLLKGGIEQLGLHQP